MAVKTGHIAHANPSKLLSQMLEFQRQNPEFLTTESYVKHLKEKYPEKDWGDLCGDNPIIQQLLAASALKLDPNSEWDKPIALAFEKAGLDPRQPANWRLLISYFCWAHFGPRRGRGAPALWPPQRYCRLLQDEDRVRRDHPTFSNEDVYRTIVQRYEHYRRKNGKPLKPGRIKTALRDARDPECNPHLAAYLNLTIQSARSEHQQHKREWSPEAEAEVTRRSIEEYCRQVAALPRAENPVE
jgi:hypothetical protein